VRGTMGELWKVMVCAEMGMRQQQRGQHRVEVWQTTAHWQTRHARHKVGCRGGGAWWLPTWRRAGPAGRAPRHSNSASTASHRGMVTAKQREAAQESHMGTQRAGLQ
jgi:hypothetical protein